MADKYRYRRGPLVDVWIPKSGTVAVEQGDMLKINSAYTVTPASVSADCTGLIGVALGKSAAGDTSGTKVRLALIGYGTVFEFASAASDLHKFGQHFKITGKQTLTKKTVVNPYITATFACAVCMETMDASGTVVLVSLMPGRQQKPIGVRRSGTTLRMA